MSKTIMIVDDEKRLVSLVESYLTQEGYRVVTANNGEKGVQLANELIPDAILLDVIMPGFGGSFDTTFHEHRVGACRHVLETFQDISIERDSRRCGGSNQNYTGNGV